MKKIISLIVCTTLLLCFALPAASCLAADSPNSVFREYLSTRKHIHTQNTYTHNGGMFTTLTNHGNDGIVASKIADLDYDGNNELMVVTLVWNHNTKQNSLVLSVVENVNGKAVEQARLNLGDDITFFQDNIGEEITLVFKNNYIGLYYIIDYVQGHDVTYMICSYNGHTINTDVRLYDPGFSGGVGLYDTTYTSSGVYYDGTLLFGGRDYDADYANSGIYNSYQEAVKSRMSAVGISCYMDEYYYYCFPTVENAEILCTLISSTSGEFWKAPMTTNASFYVYANVLNNISVTLNGVDLIFDQHPTIINGRVMVPLRAIFEVLGYSVSWDSTTQTATAQKDDKTLTVQINNPEISHSGGTYIGDVAPTIISERTLVPVRAISECAGCNVEWNSNIRTVIINTNQS